ncbi:MAG TPA: hypothetical protein VMJ10_09015 [Kofleriaceae bacterium]|nr:hypothetical protein [Kofleriaceae bacterium]
MTRFALLAIVATSGCVLQAPLPQQQPLPPLPQPGFPPPEPGGSGGSGGQPEPACNAIELGAQTDVTGTANAIYDWVAPAAGRYQIEVGGDHALVLDVRAWSCNGGDLATASAPASATATATVALNTSETIAISIAGDGGPSGNYALSITHVADECGDNVCEASEDATSCPQDCGTVTTLPYCGDGVCGAGETSDSCPADCGASTGSDDGSTTTTTTGDDGSTGSDDGSTSSDDGSTVGTDDGSADDGSDYGDDGDDGDDDGDDGDDCDDCARVPHRAPAHAGGAAATTASSSSGPNR